jgi:hypothetical protein
MPVEDFYDSLSHPEVPDQVAYEGPWFPPGHRGGGGGGPGAGACGCRVPQSARVRPGPGGQHRGCGHPPRARPRRPPHGKLGLALCLPPAPPLRPPCPEPKWAPPGASAARGGPGAAFPDAALLLALLATALYFAHTPGLIVALAFFLAEACLGPEAVGGAPPRAA